jgi:hypothetical protein
MAVATRTMVEIRPVWAFKMLPALVLLVDAEAADAADDTEAAALAEESGIMLVVML